MGIVYAEITMSVDGFIAGPSPSKENPLGIGGMKLHDWAFKLAAWRQPHGMDGGEEGPQSDYVRETLKNQGAVIMGRHMFSGNDGPWDKDDNADGWWGDNPPFHMPVFVLTNYPREAVKKAGGTTFTFVTDGPESALNQAQAAAGGKDVHISGGANVIQQFIKAGLLNELELHIAPIFLGGGTRLFENVGTGSLKIKKVTHFPDVTHIRYVFE